MIAWNTRQWYVEMIHEDHQSFYSSIILHVWHFEVKPKLYFQNKHVSCPSWKIYFFSYLIRVFLFLEILQWSSFPSLPCLVWRPVTWFPKFLFILRGSRNRKKFTGYSFSKLKNSSSQITCLERSLGSWGMLFCLTLWFALYFPFFLPDNCVWNYLLFILLYCTFWIFWAIFQFKLWFVLIWNYLDRVRVIPFLLSLFALTHCTIWQ